MTDCPCPCHGDSEEGASHEDGDCCPALAEADEAFARSMQELAAHGQEDRDAAMAEWLSRVPAPIPQPVLRLAGVVTMEFDPPPVEVEQLPLWSSIEFAGADLRQRSLGDIRASDGEPLMLATLERNMRHAGMMPWPANVVPIERARRRR